MGARTRAGAGWCLLLVLAGLVSLAAGCGGGATSAPPGPPTSKVQPSPGATASPGATSGSSVHQGGVSGDVYAAVIAALREQGIGIADESGVRVTYGADKSHVTAQGGGMTAAEAHRGVEVSPSAPPKTIQVTSVTLALENGKWQVMSINGR